MGGSSGYDDGFMIYSSLTSNGAHYLNNVNIDRSNLNKLLKFENRSILEIKLPNGLPLYKPPCLKE